MDELSGQRDTFPPRAALPRSCFQLHPQCQVVGCLVGSPTQKKTSPPGDSASRSLLRCPQIDGWSDPRSTEPLENIRGPELLQVWSLGWFLFKMLLFSAALGLHCHTRALSWLQQAGLGVLTAAASPDAEQGLGTRRPQQRRQVRLALRFRGLATPGLRDRPGSGIKPIACTSRWTLYPCTRRPWDGS